MAAELKHLIGETMPKWLVRFLLRWRWGQRIVAWMGWRRFVSDTLIKPHLETCVTPSVYFQVRQQGHVRRCATCGCTLEVHWACWEVNSPRDGSAVMPEEVVKWLVAELQHDAAARGISIPTILGRFRG